MCRSTLDYLCDTGSFNSWMRRLYHIGNGNHSFNTYLSAYYVPSTILNAWDISVIHLGADIVVREDTS